MKMNPDNLRSKAHAGFSLVDIMVGMVIALLGVIIIFQVFSVSEGIKRTTTSGGDALQNGSSALFYLGRSLRQAGYGFFSSTNAAPYPADLSTTAPVVITAGAANASDSIRIAYRQTLDFGSFPPNPADFNSASAVPPALTFETISVNGVQLVSATVPDPAPPYTTLLPADAATNNVISDGIALLKAEYGIDTTVPQDGIVDVWNKTLPANVMTVLAVRIALVTRSAQPEKPSILGGACDTTTVFPASTLATAATLDLSGNVGLAAGDDWKCYRYKTFENTVSLRNVSWRP